MGASNQRATERECPLHITMFRAANLNDAHTIRQCVEIDGADPCYRAVKSCSRITALHLSASKGCVDAAECLLSLHADPNQPDDNGVTALQFAAHAGKHEVSNVLLAAGADTNHKERRMGATALHFAASRGHVEMVSLLLANDADVDAVVPGRQWTPLHHAASGTQSTAGDVCELILSAKTPHDHSTAPDDPTMNARYGLTPLLVAVKSGSSIAVKTLLRHQSLIDIGSVDAAQLSALDWAVLLHRHPNDPSILQAVRSANPEASTTPLRQPAQILERMLCLDGLGINEATYVLSSAHTVLLRRPAMASIAKTHMPMIEQLMLSTANHPQLLHWGFSLLRSVAGVEGYQLPAASVASADSDDDNIAAEEPAAAEVVEEGAVSDNSAPVLHPATRPTERDIRDLMLWTLETYVSDPVLQRAALEAMLSCESPAAHVQQRLCEVQKLIRKYADKPKAVSLLLKRELGFELEHTNGGAVRLNGHVSPGGLVALVPGSWREGRTAGAPPVYSSANWTQATRAPGLPGKELQHQGGWALHSAQMPAAALSNPLAVGHLLKSSVLGEGGCNCLFFSFTLPRAVMEELSDVWPIQLPAEDSEGEQESDGEAQNAAVSPLPPSAAKEAVEVEEAQIVAALQAASPPPPQISEAVQLEEAEIKDEPKQSWGRWLLGRPARPTEAEEVGEVKEAVAEVTEEELVDDDEPVEPSEQPFKLDSDLVMGVAVFALRHISDEEIIVDSNMPQDAFLDAF